MKRAPGREAERKKNQFLLFESCTVCTGDLLAKGECHASTFGRKTNQISALDDGFSHGLHESKKFDANKLSVSIQQFLFERSLFESSGFEVGDGDEHGEHDGQCGQHNQASALD